MSLSGAAWGIYGFILSSQVRVLPLEESEVMFFNQDTAAQIKLEVSLANLAYGKYDDVALRQELIVEANGRRLRFIATGLKTVNQRPHGPDGNLLPLAPGCFSGGDIISVCNVADSPVTALPAGGAETITPVFDLASRDCGLEHCGYLTPQALVDLIKGDVKLTYNVYTARDHVRSATCNIHMDQRHADYYVAHGYTNPRCLGVAR
mgnify:CR=1 FL=1